MFSFMELNLIPSLKQFLKNKSYYQQYKVKLMIVFHKKAIMNQKYMII